MPTLLRLDSSADLDTSVSRRITDEFTAVWIDLGGEVVSRDLHADQPPHLPHPAFHLPKGERGGVALDPAVVELQDTLVAELIDADAVLIGAPMYNYSVPSTLKAWFDYVHLPGVTTPVGDAPGPLSGKPVVVVSSRGAAYDEGTPTADWDHCLPAIRVLLGKAMGMDVEEIVAGRTLASRLPALGVEQARAELEAALATSRATARRLAG